METMEGLMKRGATGPAAWTYLNTLDHYRGVGISPTLEVVVSPEMISAVGVSPAGLAYSIEIDNDRNVGVSFDIGDEQFCVIHRFASGKFPIQLDAALLGLLCVGEEAGRYYLRPKSGGVVERFAKQVLGEAYTSRVLSPAWSTEEQIKEFIDATTPAAVTNDAPAELPELVPLTD